MNEIQIQLADRIHQLLLEPDNCEFRYQTFQKISECISDKTAAALVGAIVHFGATDCGKVRVVLSYPHTEATIGFAENWDALDEFCNAVWVVARIGMCEVVGTGNRFFVHRQGQGWIREVPSCDAT